MDDRTNSLVLTNLMRSMTAGKPVVLATVVAARGSTPRGAGAKMLVYPDGHIEGTVGGGEMEALIIDGALESIQNGETRLVSYSLVDPKRGDPGVCGGEVQVYLEPYLPPATVFVVGAGHVGRAVAHLASWLGFRVVVQDDRAELADPSHFPDADLCLPVDMKEALTQFEVSARTYVVAVTRNVMVDRMVLPQLLETQAPYIGIIGSKRRWRETRRLLAEDGLSEEQLARFRSPIGLELNAETPEEIAVSIMAEVIMHFRGGDGRPMSGNQPT
jgi:xanthine dehydrogenase accessory factor